nr:hypothetical protein [Clostridia bacterium]
MATLGLPRVRVAFLNAAAAVTRLDTTGIVALIMRDTAITAPAILTYPTLELALADKAWVVANATALKLAFKGDPRLVRVAALPTAGLMTAAYDLLDVMQFDVCCLVGGVADDMTSFVTWAKTSYDTRRKHALYVATATVTPDSPYLIWYATDSAVTSAGAYDAKTFLPRIAGLVAGLPLYQAPTYYVLDDVTDCTRLTRAQADTAIAAGKLVLYNDGVKVKVARGVNSLITVPGVLSYTDEWKKIKVVRILN